VVRPILLVGNRLTRMRSGKYRYRTALREGLPESVAALIPKGRHNCGDHEWYKAAEQTWRCYYNARQIVRCNTVLTVFGGVGGIMVV